MITVLTDGLLQLAWQGYFGQTPLCHIQIVATAAISPLSKHDWDQSCRLHRVYESQHSNETCKDLLLNN